MLGTKCTAEVYSSIAAAKGQVQLERCVHCPRYLMETEDGLPTQARTPDQPVTQFIAVIGKFNGAEVRVKHADATDGSGCTCYSACVRKYTVNLPLTNAPIVTPATKLGCVLPHLRR